MKVRDLVTRLIGPDAKNGVRRSTPAEASVPAAGESRTVAGRSVVARQEPLACRDTGHIPHPDDGCCVYCGESMIGWHR